MKIIGLKKVFFFYLICFFFNTPLVAESKWSVVGFEFQPGFVSDDDWSSLLIANRIAGLQPYVEIPKYNSHTKTLSIPIVQLDGGFVADSRLIFNDTEFFEILSYSEIRQESALFLNPNIANYDFEEKKLFIPFVKTDNTFIEGVNLTLNSQGKFEIVSYLPSNMGIKVTADKYNQITKDMSLEEVNKLIGFNAESLGSSNKDGAFFWMYVHEEYGYLVSMISVDVKLGRLVEKEYVDHSSKFTDKYSNVISFPGGTDINVACVFNHLLC